MYSALTEVTKGTADCSLYSNFCRRNAEREDAPERIIINLDLEIITVGKFAF